MEVWFYLTTLERGGQQNRIETQTAVRFRDAPSRKRTTSVLSSPPASR